MVEESVKEQVENTGSLLLELQNSDKIKLNKKNNKNPSPLLPHPILKVSFKHFLHSDFLSQLHFV